jgi:DNA-binding MarR family transcriptional regulator
MTITDRVLTTDVQLAEQLFDAIGQLRRLARRSAGRAWPIAELSGAQLELVRLIRREPGMSVAAAAAELGLAANTVSTLVGELTEAGMVRRTRDATDRRIARLQLTASARRRVETWRDRRTALTADAIADLSPAARAALARAVPVMAELASAIGDGRERSND